MPKVCFSIGRARYIALRLICWQHIDSRQSAASGLQGWTLFLHSAVHACTLAAFIPVKSPDLTCRHACVQLVPGHAHHGQGGRACAGLSLDDLCACVLDAVHHLGQLSLLELDLGLRLQHMSCVSHSSGRYIMRVCADGRGLASTTSVPAFWMRSTILASSASSNLTWGCVCNTYGVSALQARGSDQTQEALNSHGLARPLAVQLCIFAKVCMT